MKIIRGKFYFLDIYKNSFNIPCNNARERIIQLLFHLDSIEIIIRIIPLVLS